MMPELTLDDRAELRRIVARLTDQDNACTKEPMFCVQKAVRHQGLDASLAADEDEIEWVRHGEVCPESWRDALNAAYENGDNTVTLDGESYDMSDFERYGFKDDYETVMIALTREGCEKYLSRDGHNLRSKYGAPRIYVESFYRCEEMIALRRMLPALAAGMDELDRLRGIIAHSKAALHKIWPEGAACSHTHARAVFAALEEDRAGAAATEALRESLAGIIEKRLERLEERGFIVQSCEDHGNEDIRHDPLMGAFCGACSDDGFSGELCSLGLDSEAIELADKLIAVMHRGAEVTP